MLSDKSITALNDIATAIRAVPSNGVTRTNTEHRSTTLETVKANSWYNEKYVLRDTINSELVCIIATYEIVGSFSLSISIYDVNKREASKYAKRHADRLARWIYVMATNAPILCVNQMSVHWLLYNDPKKRPEADRVTPHMVNTGYTWRCKNPNVIVLYRTEDAFKVFVHETMHSFGYDSMLLDSQSMSSVAKLRFGVYTVDMHEVCSEFFARLVVIAEAHPSDAEKRAQLLRKNVKWGLAQGMKLIGRREYRNALLGKTHDSLYREDTPAFSYYVATGVLLYAFCYAKIDNGGSFSRYVQNTMRYYFEGRSDDIDHILVLIETIERKKMGGVNDMQMVIV